MHRDLKSSVRLTLRQDFGVSAQSNAQGGDTHTEVSASRSRLLKRKLPPDGGNFQLKPKSHVKLSFWLGNLHGYITS